MSLDQRLWLFILGCCLGFIFGYLTRLLRETRTSIRAVQHSIEEIEEHEKHQSDSGFIHPQITFNNVMLLVVIIATVYASFISQRSSNNIRHAQEQIAQSTLCNQQFLKKTIVALNGRTKSTARATKANVDLVDSETHFFGILLHTPPYGPDVQAHAATVYFTDLSSFLKISKKLAHERRANPFPTLNGLHHCLRNK